MNKGIAHVLKERIKTLPYIDLIGGLVYVQEFEDLFTDATGRESRVTKRIPVTDDVINGCGCQDKNGLFAMVPDSTKRGMVYFEDNGTRPYGQPNSRSFPYKSSLRLVCWLNTEGLDAVSCGQMETRVIMAINSLIGFEKSKNEDVYLAFKVIFSGSVLSSNRIFDKYTYDIKNTQYLMPPYLYFAMDLEVSYKINKDCVLPVGIKNCEEC